MTPLLEKFIGFTTNLPREFLYKLDRNFERVEIAHEIVSLSDTVITLKSTDNINSVIVDTTAANGTVYLPTQPTGIRRRTVTKSVAANVLIIDGNGSTIYGPGGWAAGVSQAFLNNQWESLTFEPTGTAWIIVASVP